MGVGRVGAGGVVVPPPTGGDFMLIDQAALLSLSASGTAWDNMKAEADNGSKGTPSLVLDAANVVQARYLASAIVYARIGGPAYKDEVVLACRDIMGTEDDAGSGSNSLRVNRQLAGWIWAADFVGMDTNLTGTGAGYTSTTWAEWLEVLITKTLAGHSSWNSIENTSRLSVGNHGAYAHSAYAAVASYLDLSAHKTTAWDRYRGFLGDRTVTKTQSINSSVETRVLTYVCLPEAGMTAADDWVPLNPAAPCTRSTHDGSLDVDGLWIEDGERDGASYPTIGSQGLAVYLADSTGGMMCAGLIWRRSGHTDAFTIQDDWFKRAMDCGVRVSVDQNGTAWGRNQPWVANSIYGTSYTEVATSASSAHSISWADWLFP